LFFCKKRDRLLRVVHPGYHTSFDYYHEDCLKKVLDSPESYPKFVDSAIQITDQLRKDEENQKERERSLQLSINRLKILKETEKLEKIKQSIEVVREIKKEVCTETSKFQKIFKNG
jgi:hypothetical protein